MKINVSNRTYDVLNSLVRYLLPALGTLYFSMSELWGLPEPERVLGTVVALETFLGVVLYLASRGWVVPTDGELIAHEEDGGYVTASFDRPTEELYDQDYVTLKVNRGS